MKRWLLACFWAAVMLFGVMLLMVRADGPVVDMDQHEEDLRVIGEESLDYLGEMATGDINQDGIPDLIVGASGYDVDGGTPITNAGAVYVIFGSPLLSGTLDLNGSAENADVIILGYVEDGYAGHTVTSGDVNGDGYADIVIGADCVSLPGRQVVGAVYVIPGPITQSLSTPIYLSDTNWVTLTVYGDNDYDRLGRAVATGDVNGDAVADLVVGAYRADGPHGSDSGRAYVFYGGSSLSGTIDLHTDTADVTIIGDDGYDRLGRSLTTGDVNGDGLADLLIGAYWRGEGVGPGAGEVVLIYGSDSLSATIDLSQHNLTGSGLGMRFYGVDDGDGAGFFVDAGNIDGDINPDNGEGYDDILISAYLENYNEDGEAYLLYGGPALTAGLTITSGTWTVLISDCADVVFYPANTGDRLGRSLTSADLNGDGYEDIVLGASRADPSIARVNAGETYVFYGGAPFSPTLLISPTGNTDLTVLGDRPDDESGRSTAFGDLNGDRVDDLIIGAVMADSGVGEVYIIWGPRATTLHITPATETITAGETTSFTVTAENRYSQSWDVTTYTTTFDVPLAAGGVWAGNIYTSEKAGTWTVTATHRGLTTTAILTVTHAAMDSLLLTPQTETISSGSSISYTLLAHDVYTNEWDVTLAGTFTTPFSAGGAWAQRVYTAENDGTWIITGTYAGLWDTATLTVTNVAPTAVISGTASGNEGDELWFDASLSSDPGNDIVLYEWDFEYSGVFAADATGLVTTHTYAHDGAYTLALRVTDDNAATDLTTTTVSIQDLDPTAGFEASPRSGIEPLTVVFTDTSTSRDGIVAWVWDFGDGTPTATVGSPSHEYGQGGVYTVTLQVWEADGDTDVVVEEEAISVGAGAEDIFPVYLPVVMCH